MFWLITKCPEPNTHIALQCENKIEQTGWSHSYSGGIDGNIFGHTVNLGWIIVVLHKIEYVEAKTTGYIKTMHLKMVHLPSVVLIYATVYSDHR